MRNRYRFYVCPEDECPQVGVKDSKCLTHNVAMVAVILRRETPENNADLLRGRAERVREAGEKVNPKPDPFGLAGLADLFGKNFPR